MTSHNTATTELTRAVLASVVFAAKLLQQDRALLLSQAVSVFLNNYPPAKDNEDLYLELRDGTIKFSARWLMNQLIIHLQPFMKALSLALHYLSSGSTDPEHEHLNPPYSQIDATSVIREAGNVLNDIIHEEIR